MIKARLLVIIGILLVLSGLTLAVVSSQATQPDTPMPIITTTGVSPTLVNLIPLPSTISGIVLNEEGPVAGAIVQIQATTNVTESAEDGSFTLSGIQGTTPLVLTAWSRGHYVGWMTLNPSAPDWKGGSEINLVLRELPQGDNSEYEGFSFEGVTGSASCGICHREYPEWQADLHAHAATNTHFISMYLGTNVDGEAGQPTQFGSEGQVLPLDPNLPHYGPGFRLDNVNRAGNCATCHTPFASTAPNNKNCTWSGCHTDLTIERSNGILDEPAIPTSSRASAMEGISCEFCHKVSGVYLNPATNLPYEDMPGILSLQMARPSDDSEQVFFGTLVDVARDDSYLPLLSQSEFCAGCHYGVLGGVVGNMTVTGGTLVYSSYSEWLDSPYSDPETGMTCQDCHMPVSSANWFVVPERGGLVRDYAELHNHTMPGASDETLLQNTVTMISSAERTGDQLQVQVSITNDKAGHHVPTDVPIRSLILVVEALDEEGNPLALLEGSVNPDYSGDLGGLPGRTFAKVLRDEWTGETPTGAFWRETTIAEDTRIAALATNTTNYTFDAPAGEAVTINVRLVFRRSFYELQQQKGWNDPDILMEYETLQLPAN
jgi:hypothetical protein